MLNRLGDYYQDAIDGNIVLTKFLDLSEINEIKSLEKDGLKVYFEGGYDNAERVRAIIQYSSYLEPSLNDFQIKIYHAKFNKTFSDIGHRNVLGSIMTLGIERNTFGDIYIFEDNIYLFISSEIEKYLIGNIPLINHQNLNFVEVSQLPKIHQMPETEKTVNVASMRLDAIISRCTNISRNEAVELIESGLVSINHKIIKSITYKCVEDDLISIRKYGRIRIIENIKTTKKDRLVLKIGVKH